MARLLTGGLVALAAASQPLGAQERNERADQPRAQPAGGLPSAAPEAMGMSARGLARIDSLVREYVRHQRIAGAVTLVARDGRIVHHSAQGVRDLATGEPLRPDDIFRVASQTKALTSVAVMTLVEEGRIRLSDPVSRFIPAFSSLVVGVPVGDSLSVEPAGREITIRDLLTHTSGISYGTESHLADLYEEAGLYSWYFADQPRPIGHAIRRLAELPLAAAPGTRWIYGLSTDLLGVVAERASGRGLHELLRERILAPLEMHDTHFYLPAGKADRLAAVHAVGDHGRIVRAPERGRTGQGDYVSGPRRAYSGGAGLLSTAGDYARFLQMLLEGGELDGVRILAPETVREMTSNQVGALYVAPGHGFGLGFEIRIDEAAPVGWDVPARSAAGSFGWGGAYHSTYWVDPENRLIGMFLTQLIPATGLDIRQRFKELVYDAILTASTP